MSSRKRNFDHMIIQDPIRGELYVFDEERYIPGQLGDVFNINTIEDDYTITRECAKYSIGIGDYALCHCDDGGAFMVWVAKKDIDKPVSKLESADLLIKNNGKCIGVSGLRCDDCCLISSTGCKGGNDEKRNLKLAKEYKKMNSNKSEFKKFRLEDYKGKYVMHVDTEEEYNTFSKFLHENGKTWCTGKGYLECSHWELYKNESCFDFNDGVYDSLGWFQEFEERSYTILEFSDFNWNVCEFIKNQEVEISANGECYGRGHKEKFYGYDGSLEKPYLTIDKDGDIMNWQHCRAIQPKYEAYHKFDSEWIGKKVVLKTSKDHDSIQTILGTDIPNCDLPDRIYLRNDFNNAINCISNWNERLFKIATWKNGKTFGEEIK